MVKLRLARAGAKKNPYYRVVVADARSPRDGAFLEQIGTYNPRKDPAEFKLNVERWTYWTENGALPTTTVHRLFLKHIKDVPTVG